MAGAAHRAGGERHPPAARGNGGERAGTRGRRMALRRRRAADRRPRRPAPAPCAPGVARSAGGTTGWRALAVAGAAVARVRESQFRRHRRRARGFSRPRASDGSNPARGDQRAACNGAQLGRYVARTHRGSNIRQRCRSGCGRVARRTGRGGHIGHERGPVARFQCHRHHAPGGDFRSARDAVRVAGDARGARVVALFTGRGAPRSRAFCNIVSSRGGRWLRVARRVLRANTAHLADARHFRSGAAGCAPRRRRPDLVAGAGRRAAARCLRAAGGGFLVVVHRRGGDSRDRNQRAHAGVSLRDDSCACNSP